MPIMAAHDENDVRGSARLLASAAMKCVEEAHAPSKHLASLKNFFRLLEAYRSHRFVGFEYEPRATRGPEALTLMPPTDRHVTDLRAALDSAFAEVYKDRDLGKAVDAIEDVLRWTAYPEKKPAPPDGDRERVTVFLKAFIDKLYAVR